MIDVFVCVCVSRPPAGRWCTTGCSSYSRNAGSTATHGAPARGTAGARRPWRTLQAASSAKTMVGGWHTHSHTHTHTQTHTLAASHPGTKLRVNTSFWWINVCSGYSDSCFLEKKMGCVTVERTLNEISIKGMKEKDSTLSGVCFYVNALWLCRLPAVCKIHAYHGRINSAQQHLQYKQEDVLNINIITSRGLSFYTSAWRCSHSRCWPRWRQTG